MIAAIEYAWRAAAQAREHDATRGAADARDGVKRTIWQDAMDRIVIKGAREHNLKNIDLEIPRDRLVVITGLSGSGKSSLAFDTIYAEGQRRYVESLSAYARQFLEQMEKPDVDSIEGLSPAISIEQKTTSRNPRSTVGTITEIYDYLRLLFARVGHAFCYNCGREITQQSVQQIVDRIMALARRHAHPRARADRARSQGRVSQGAERSAPRRLRARQDRRQAARTRRGDRAQQEPAPHHRGDGRSPRDPPAGSRSGSADSLEVAFKYGQDLLKIERLDGRRTQAKSTSASASRASNAAFRIRRSRRGCSPSTVRTAPARNARVSARSCTSIPSWWCRTRT